MSFLSHEVLFSSNWSEFERLVYRLLQHSGWTDLFFTPRSNDKGADIVGCPPKSDSFVVIQCKHTASSSISLNGVKDLVRACDFYGTSRGILVTNSKLSEVGKNYLQSLSEHYHFRVWDLRALSSMDTKFPEDSAIRRSPRAYQESAISEVISYFNEGGRRCLVTFATGLGKSIILAEVAAEFAQVRKQPVLVLATQITLIEQLETSIWPQLSKSILTRLWDASRKPSSFDGVTVASQQSVLNAIAKGESMPRFGAVLVDECHHAASPTFRQTLDSMEFDHLLGVTATPWRGDEIQLTEVFGPVKATMGIVEGIKKGFLADVNYLMYTDNLNWELIEEKTKNKLSIRDLNTRLFLPARDEDLCTKVVQFWNANACPQVITFCRSIDHANRLAELFCSMGLPSRAVHSRDMSRPEVAKTIMQFRLGEFSNLVGVEILNEGIDVPDVGMVVFARVTHSRRIFVQQLGRGLRVTNTKSLVHVLDFVADIRRIAEGFRMNREADEYEQKREVYRGSGAELVHFQEKIARLFVEEYLSDVADLEENDRIELNYLSN